MTRPIGWWIKKADWALEGAFEMAFAAAGTSRREWQVLSTVAVRPVVLADLCEALQPFADEAGVVAVVNDLCSSAMLEGSGRVDDALRLTQVGVAYHHALTVHVDAVRRSVTQALPPGDYMHLTDLLGRLIDALEPGRADRN